MGLYDEEELRKQRDKDVKIKKVIIASIVITVILIVVIMGVIFYLLANPNKVSISVNGQQNKKLENLIEVEEQENGDITISAPIKDIAPIFNYQAFNGEYTLVSESTDSCYVESEVEVAIFNVDSDIIYKLDKSNSDSDYEYCKIENKIFKKDDKLYVSNEGLEEAFNIVMSYNKDRKLLNIYTLDNLVTKATTVAQKKGYQQVDPNLINQKAIFESMIVVTNTNGLFGVIDYSTGEEILGTQYDNITYIPHKSAFLITKNDKVGIIASDGTTKLAPIYDNLTLIDYENELYMAESNGRYGIVNINGSTVIYLDYDGIGINVDRFNQSGIKNGYVLLNKLIPVQRNGKWGFFDIRGKQVTQLIYDNIGCENLTSGSLNYPLLLIPEANIIAVNRDGKYTFINLNGEEVVDCIFKEVYIEDAGGEQQYYMVWQNPTTGQDQRYVVTEHLRQ